MPADLGSVLRRRGIEPAHRDSACPALAELCLNERGSARPKPSVLILAGVQDPARMLSAIERFAPSARVWNFEPGANPPLRAVVVSVMPVVAAPESIVPRTARQAASSVGVCETREAISRAEGALNGVHRAGEDRAVNDTRSRPARDVSHPVSVVELKLATGSSDPVLDDADARGVRARGVEADRTGQDPAPPARARSVSSRDVLEDAELEMLLAGERGTEGHGR